MASEICYYQNVKILECNTVEIVKRADSVDGWFQIFGEALTAVGCVEKDFASGVW